MRGHVRGEVTLAVEGLLADRAREGLLFGVHDLVFAEHLEEREAFAALRAAEGSLAGVRPHVDLERVLGEAFVADGAGVGFFSRVEAEVRFQGALL